jgi:outer membrane receptor for ferrienterochelin and colicins
MLRRFIFLLFSFLYLGSQAQIKDSSKHYALEEVVVTATRNEKQLSALPMPVTLISGRQIRQMGSLRLNEVLQEQTGLAIINDHGNGIQMQGFAPDYTLILIDGEPLIGRTAGTLELSRITVGNIRQIEIVKGPSSSLYGSEAMGGVINIITEKPDGLKGNFKARYGSNQTSDFTTDFSVRYKKLNMYVFGNRYRTGGYDLTPEEYGNTVEPFTNYTFQSKIGYDFTSKIQFSVSGRHFSESQTMGADVGSASSAVLISGKGAVKDWNINPQLKFKVSPDFTLNFRLYNGGYHTTSKQVYQTDNQVYDESYFTQTFLRPEIITQYNPNLKHSFTVGAGHITESVNATRYTDKKVFETWYGLFQYEWLPADRFNLIVGGRFDKQSVYGSQFSPKLSVQYDLMPWLALRASVGAGFKAPDFRQLYLNFTNAVAGYSVFGTEELIAGLARLNSEGQIADYLMNPAVFGKIKAESSIAYNAGFKFSPVSSLKGNINFFRNNIKNLIETQAVAQKKNGQNVFSYRNISRVYTEGIETDWSYQLLKNLTLSAGYQLLFTADEDVLKGIEAGQYYRRNPETLATTRVTKSQYGGLFNRSRHSGNLKIFYEEPKTGISGSLRGIYRGRYGAGDFNGNLILDDNTEYVKGYFQINMAVAKTFKKSITIQSGVDNLLNFTNKQYMPGIPGRLFYASISLGFSKKQSQMSDQQMNLF